MLCSSSILVPYLFSIKSPNFSVRTLELNHKSATNAGFVNSLDVGLRLSRDYWVSGDFLVIELGMLRPVNTGEASITVL